MVFINASLRQRTITLVVEAFYSIFFLCVCVDYSKVVITRDLPCGVL